MSEGLTRYWTLSKLVKDDGKSVYSDSWTQVYKVADVDALLAELDAYRAGGVTEKLLRKQDGYLKIGRGCVVVRDDEWNAMQGGPP